ncbi:hypothetical protein [Citrobacter sp. Cf224]|uniref:hypothetical protein n=1 Tax=Citrobacter sp. Cf224 TaxID=2985087 RepID=UPI0025773650|nr:hypothetical protein [Citrobacter sp. Cf224]MDM3071466.1 hypothetical protein [Citrobacter sp. Cf224]
MTVYEMEGFLRGKCVPGDMKVNESNAQYLVRKFSELQSQNADMAVQLANAESKCRELAAENARCKFEVSRCHQTVDEMFKNRDKWIDKEWLSSIWSTSKRLMNETPATDAFLAEVRSQGVDAAIEHLSKKFEGTGHIGVPVMALEWLAQEIRKGEAQ